MDLKRFDELKRGVDRLQREVSRAEGVREELLRRLKSEFKCDSLKEAERLLARMKKDYAKIEKDYEVALGNFEEQWGDVLEG